MSMAEDIFQDIKNSIDELEKLPNVIEKNDSIKQALLEIQVQLSDCVVDMRDNLEIVEGYYEYNETLKKPQYIISMSPRMEKELIGRIKNDPMFKVHNELIANDKSFPDTIKTHIGGILSTLIFSYIKDGFIKGPESEKDTQTPNSSLECCVKGNNTYRIDLSDDCKPLYIDY